MRTWLTIKWIKNDAGRWIVMSVHPGCLKPDPDKFVNYTVQEVEVPGECLLIPPAAA